MTTGSSSTHTAWWLTTCHGSPESEQNVGLHRGAWLRQAWETMDIQAFVQAPEIGRGSSVKADPLQSVSFSSLGWGRQTSSFF